MMANQILRTFAAPTSPDADNGILKPITITQGARIRAKYADMTTADSIVVHWGPTYKTPAKPGDASLTVEFLIPSAEVAPLAGTSFNVHYTVTYPGGPTNSATRLLTLEGELTISITEVLDANLVLIPDGSTTTSTTVTVKGTVSTA